MPRDIVLGNGELLVNLDRHLSIRDIYYPYVGWANHVGGHRCRVGVWVAVGGFSWLDDSWEWQIQYVPATIPPPPTAASGNMPAAKKASRGRKGRGAMPKTACSR